MSRFDYLAKFFGVGKHREEPARQSATGRVAIPWLIQVGGWSTVVVALTKSEARALVKKEWLAALPDVVRRVEGLRRLPVGTIITAKRENNAKG